MLKQALIFKNLGLKRKLIIKSDVLRYQGIFLGHPIIGPRQLNLHVTNVCDRKCIFCWYNSPLVSKKDAPRHMNFGVIKRLILDCKEMNIGTINLEGGEITLYPEINKLFLLIKSAGFRLITYSHLAFSGNHLDYLRFADSINVNLSASNKDSYIDIHGDNKFQQVIKNLYSLYKLKREYGKPEIILSFIITELNYKQIKKFIGLAKKLHVDKIKFKLHIATKELQQLVLTENSFMRLRKMLSCLLKQDLKIKNNLMQIYNIITNDNFLKNRFYLNWTNRHNDRYFYYYAFPGNRINCFIGWFYSLIDEKGRVIAPCDNVGVCIAGNIHKESFKHIWYNSYKFKKIRNESMNEIDIRQKKWNECRYCGYVALNKKMLSVIKTINPKFFLKNIVKE